MEESKDQPPASPTSSETSSEISSEVSPIVSPYCTRGELKHIFYHSSPTEDSALEKMKKAELTKRVKQLENDLNTVRDAHRRRTLEKNHCQRRIEELSEQIKNNNYLFMQETIDKKVSKLRNQFLQKIMNVCEGKDESKVFGKHLY